MCGLYHPLRQFCTRHPDVFRRAQVLIDVDKKSEAWVCLTVGMLRTVRLMRLR